ncbi:MAG: S9 family peptidase [Candidatus Rifleibacteriota bacterium]
MITQPEAKREVKVYNMHNHKILDPYYWFRNKNNPEVIRYLDRENRYTEAIMADTGKTQKYLFEEMKSRIKETDMSVPTKDGPYIYYSRTREGSQYPIHCRKPVDDPAVEQIIFDENIYAKNHSYFATGDITVSPAHDILAYSTDFSGSEKFNLRFKNLETGEEYPESISSTTYGLVWAEDNKTVFYTLSDQTGRAYRIMKHRLNTPVASDSIVYEEKDGKYWVNVSKTRDKKYVLISSNSSTTSEVRYLKADNPDGEFKIFSPRKKGIEYYLAHQNNDFYILTNENARNFKILKTTDQSEKQGKLETFIEHDPDILIDDIAPFADFIVISFREKGLTRLKVYDLNSREFKTINLDEPVYSVYLDDNPEYDTDKIRFRYTSLTTPESIFDYNIISDEKILKKQYEVLGTFRSDNYISERIFATAVDGTKIPISLVYRKDQKKGPSPLYLTGYGSYGSSFDPYFSSIRLSLLDRGFTYAIAHVRGGQEMGRFWYEDGKLLKKKNSFSDFIACAEHLITNNYTSPDDLVIQGGSAGGLLVCTVTNMRPELFKIVVADVPFVDVINTMSDPTLPLVKEEYEEWGNPADPEYFKYMMSYSPYDNIKKQDYPTMLVTAGLNDPRVSYWEPAKLVARLRSEKTDNNILLLKTNMKAGHSGASGRYDFLKEIAFEYAFILKFMGIKF